MEYIVAVRTYKRPTLFRDRTLRVLREQGMADRLFVFVGSDIAEYATLEPDLRYIQAPVGGNNAIRAICEHFPRGTPILFLDDDLESFDAYDWETDSFKHTGLHEMVVRGFEHAPFGFGFLKNRMWLRKQKEFRPSYSTMGGCAFGAFNEPELIATPTPHCDDLMRTIQYFKAGRVPWSFTGAGFKTRYAKNPGGLQASGDRADTMVRCQAIAPLVEGWVSEIVKNKAGLYAWKLLAAGTIKKKVAAVTGCLSLTTEDSASSPPHTTDHS